MVAWEKGMMVVEGEKSDAKLPDFSLSSAKSKETSGFSCERQLSTVLEMYLNNTNNNTFIDSG